MATVTSGLESPGEWDDHHRIFALDGPDVQYAGAQTESLPYVYYTPTYGYAQSPYNPYNPYIPGAAIGVDGPFAGTQQFYTIPPFQNPPSSPAYYPLVVQPRPDIVPNSSPDHLLDTGSSTAIRPNGRGLKHNLSSTSAAFTMTPPRPASNQTHSLARVAEASRATAGPSKQPVTHGSVTSGSFRSPTSLHVVQGRGASGSIQTIDNISNGRVLSHRNHLKVTAPVNNGLSDFGSTTHGRAAVDKLRPKFHYGRALNDVNGSPDALSEQNRGPRTNKSKNQLAVKAYTTKAGDGNAQANIIIYTDQYNKDDFPVDYVNAKFFVIKSYSEDDVHKSIKYNVWSSTPNGNKKLDNAYIDAQRISSGEPSGCPVFLFFSVNASGQFCGVAEMTGPVDFQKDMDFWQQDKWSGSFPLKWHIIKDVPNTNFRHIILENNENKPVTNSRDTQEKIMQEEKARVLLKTYESPFLVPALDPPRKLNCVVDLPPKEDEKITKHTDSNSSDKKMAPATEKVSANPDATSISSMIENAKQIEVEAKGDITSTLTIGSLTISPKQAESKPLVVASTVVGTESVDVVTVGSMPVKVNGFSESSGLLTVGTIPLDPRALQLGKAGVYAKGGPQK
ncbi:hypothetical protein L1049_016977 [Liquidambar formosana]|uniref:YTH domain-containing family protein n=1 Tax=Liquidambar formosana TaxID=63359 RepID=A0AAP0X755_LIQFO